MQFNYFMMAASGLCFSSRAAKPGDYWDPDLVPVRLVRARARIMDLARCAKRNKLTKAEGTLFQSDHLADVPAMERRGYSAHRPVIDRVFEGIHGRKDLLTLDLVTTDMLGSSIWTENKENWLVVSGMGDSYLHELEIMDYYVQRTY